LIGSVLLVTLPLAWWLLRSKNRKTDRAVLYFNLFCAKLAKAGIEIRLGEGARDFAERAKRQYPEQAAQIEQLTAIFIRLRYQSDAKADDLQALKSLVAGFHT
jgi:hypothetical protein